MACIGSRTFRSDAYPARPFAPVSSALLRSLAPSRHVSKRLNFLCRQWKQCVTRTADFQRERERERERDSERQGKFIVRSKLDTLRESDGERERERERVRLSEGESDRIETWTHIHRGDSPCFQHGFLSARSRPMQRGRRRERSSSPQIPVEFTGHTRWRLLPK